MQRRLAYLRRLTVTEGAPPGVRGGIGRAHEYAVPVPALRAAARRTTRDRADTARSEEQRAGGAAACGACWRERTWLYRRAAIRWGA